MKLGLAFLVFVAGAVLAAATHNFVFGAIGLVAMFVAWKIETTT